MASILFRMVNSFAGDAGRLAPARNPTQCIFSAIVPQKTPPYTWSFWAFLASVGTGGSDRRLLSWNRLGA
jgi:hypothetical protein